MEYTEILGSFDKSYAAKRDNVKDNKAAIIAAIRAVGANKAVFEYDGSGDSSSYDTVSLYDDDKEVEFGEAVVKDYAELSSLWDREGWKKTITKSDKPLKDALEDIGYDLVNGNFPGWENNDGAYGTVTFMVTEDSIELVHNARRTEVDTDTVTV